MSQRTLPSFNAKEFHCPICGVYSAQVWNPLVIAQRVNLQTHLEDGKIDSCYCVHCNNFSYWVDAVMVHPSSTPAPPPHPDLPTAIASEYSEAQAIVTKSPRAAAALLRLAIQKLMQVLGLSGKNINDDIQALAANGLPVVVQQALDFCRVVGNNAVHPGEINLQDTPEMALSLFDMVNFIVEDRIARPKQVTDLYNKLPAGARAAIERRDAKP